jgi:hypothetical protein
VLRAAAAALALLATCRSGGPQSAAPATGGVAAEASSGVDAWEVVYTVLQHPRCLNCHPAGDRPLQGDASQPHVQNVRRGPDGKGHYALRCDACHQDHNLPGPHLPPGAPSWHLPHPGMPLVFEGRTSSELCRQLRDPAQNGGRTPAQLEHHMEQDPLVLWGWDPGPGRAPVPTPQPEFAEAVRAWVAAGCDCP